MFDVLRRQWPVLLAGLLLGVVSGIVFDLLERPAYTATAYTIVVPDKGGATTVDSAVSIAQGYGRLATNPSVVSGGLARRGIDVAPNELKKAVRASTSPEAPIIEIDGTWEQPLGAASLANGVAEQLTTYSGTLRPALGYRVLLFAGASPPTTRSDPSMLFHAALAGAAGLLTGGLVALLLGGAVKAPLRDRTRGRGNAQGSGEEDGEWEGSTEPGTLTAEESSHRVEELRRGLAEARAAERLRSRR